MYTLYSPRIVLEHMFKSICPPKGNFQHLMQQTDTSGFKLGEILPRQSGGDPRTRQRNRDANGRD